MIHIFVGTKAQFIKMAPVMQELARRGIEYNFIDAGQHAALTEDLVHQFQLKPPDARLRKEGTSIATIRQAVRWVFKNIFQVIFKKRQILDTVFKRRGGICLIHGDTLTTLVSLVYAKRCSLKVAHVEAGLRSYNLLNPFPEEIIRLIAMKYSDILFASSIWAYKNLKEMGCLNKTVKIDANTGLDAVRYALQQPYNRAAPGQPYVIFTIHRFETIYSYRRLSLIVNLIERIAVKYEVLFLVHEPTKQQLLKYNLYERITGKTSIRLLSLQPYIEFINLLAGAEFVVSDGGSIQEETYFLNVPCLIMRAKTERMEGSGENALLADFAAPKINLFLERLPELQRRDLDIDLSPSAKIVDYLTPFI